MQPRGRRRWDAIPDRKLSEYDELTQAIIGAAINHRSSNQSAQVLGARVARACRKGWPK
jgi:hypothetical protein